MDQKTKAWDSIATYLHAIQAKALVGTSLSCDETADDKDWQDVLQLLQKIGPDNVLGLAIGNELDLLWQNGASAKCVTSLWQQQYVLNKFKSRVADMDKLGVAWQSVKVTSVFSEYILAGKPFVNDPKTAEVLPFIQNVLAAYKTRFVLSFNNYPYFDVHNFLDKPGVDKCTDAIQKSTCFTEPDCKFSHVVIAMRERMEGVSAADNLLWVTETGWSSPKADTLKWNPMVPIGQQSEMANCTDFSSAATMQTYYNNFLKWDLSITGKKGPDHVFYFGMRDSSSFGSTEHFGLGEAPSPETLCATSKCKLQQVSLPEETIV